MKKVWPSLPGWANSKPRSEKSTTVGNTHCSTITAAVLFRYGKQIPGIVYIIQNCFCLLKIKQFLPNVVITGG